MNETFSVESLVTQLGALDSAYYDQGESLVPDRDYDRLATLYQQATGLPWHRQGQKGDVAHARLMGTLAKAHHVAELRKDLGDTECVFEPKIDGLGLELSYAGGVLVRALTRGHRSGGISYGEVVTDKVKWLVPSTIPDKRAVTIRGEVYLPTVNFEAANRARVLSGENPFKNCRNAAAGILNKGEVDSLRFLQFVAYKAFSTLAEPHQDVLFVEETQMLLALARWGFDIPSHFRGSLDDFDAQALEGWVRAGNFPYDTDGIVVVLDRWEHQRQLGSTSEFPRYARAYKFGDTCAETVLVAIHWEATRTGRIVPTYVFKPVELEGATITQATGHNLANVLKLLVAPGDTVSVYRANMVIPQVKGGVHAGDAPLTIPDYCPSCNHLVDQNEVDLLCSNTGCPAKLAGQIQNACGKKNLDVDGVGDSLADALVSSGLVHDLADFLALGEKDLDKLVALPLGDSRVSLGTSRAQTLLDGLQRAKQKPWPIVLHALGCPGLGEPECAEIASVYSLDDLLVPYGSELVTHLALLKGIGEKTATVLVGWLTGNHDWLITFSRLGFNTEKASQTKSSGGILSGKTLVVTGTLSVPRSVIERRITTLGGALSSSVSKNTTYLVAGDSAGSKLDKALKLGIPVLDEAGFETLITSLTI